MDDQVSNEPVSEGEAQPRHSRRRGEGWIGGLILILLGVIFLLNNTGTFSFDNWWALFILIPAVGSFGEAWRKYQDAGRLNADARGALIGGLLISTVAFAFLFEVDWKYLWPLFMIGGGLLFLLNALLPE